VVSQIRSILSLILVLFIIIAILPAQADDTANSTADLHKYCCARMCDCSDRTATSNHLSSNHADVCLCSHPSTHQKATVPVRAGHTISPMTIEVLSPLTSCETPTHRAYCSAQRLSFSAILIPTHISLRAPPVCV